MLTWINNNNQQNTSNSNNGHSKRRNALKYNEGTADNSLDESFKLENVLNFTEECKKELELSQSYHFDIFKLQSLSQSREASYLPTYLL